MDKNQSINTKVLPGFMELLPADQIEFDRMKTIIQETYERFGFVSIDTPTIERAEVLFAKAGDETEKQIYRFTKGDTDLALRFDLTVPLARYVSEHVREITFPFRRCHIGKVYRGESPQKGRFREFYQCDIDIIGKGSLSLVNDAEIPSVIYNVFNKLSFGPFVIRISNRKILKGLLEGLGITQEQAVEIMRVVDKIDKIGGESVKQMLLDIGINQDAVSQIFQFLSISGSNSEIISELRSTAVNNEQFHSGIVELENVIANISKLGVPGQYFAIDLSIARGLDYYTGTVYETVLTDYPKIGSVCSGGRYDNLAEKYTDEKLPGVGISIGLTRLFSQLKDAGLIKAKSSTPTHVLVIPFAADLSVPLEIATHLRNAEIATEVFLEEARFKNKIAYADKMGIPFIVIAGEDEIKSGEYTIKTMGTGKQTKVKIDDICEYIKRGGLE